MAIDDGVVLNKDGSLLAGFSYRGQDLATIPLEEAKHISAVVNAALLRLGNEWMLHGDATRLPAPDYPAAAASHFPDPVSRAIDEERRRQFQHGRYYESWYTLYFTYLPPAQRQQRFEALFLRPGGGGPGSAADGEITQVGLQSLRYFEATLEEVMERLTSVLDIERLRTIRFRNADGRTVTRDPLLGGLHQDLTGLAHPINAPACPVYLDALIGRHELWTGTAPKLEERYIQVVGVDGFPQESYPGILTALDQARIPYRWSTRFLFLDPVDARQRRRAYRRKWQQKVRGFGEQIFRNRPANAGAIDQDALLMVGETDEALSQASSQFVQYGHYTSVVVLMDEDYERVISAAKTIRRLLNNLGFAGRIETVNATDAWLGSLPGHAHPNLRRPLLHTLNLADLLPLSAVWAGEAHAPCPLYPPASPPLLQVATDGSTPFRLNLHVSDVGHTLLLGPTGAGKSTALALLTAQFLRYPAASVYVFDKGNSLEAVTRAVGGQHYRIGGKDLCFAPLAQLAAPGELGWAEEWLGGLLRLQGVDLQPQHRNELHRALAALSRGAMRTLTALQEDLQDAKLAHALEEYTRSGALGALLDSDTDDLNLSRWACFELEALMEREDRTRLPVLLYLFHAVERRLRGQPALIVLDEAWLMLGHAVFRDRIRQWLKTLRKKNCAVVLATQSLSDLSGSGILDVLIESCPTRIFLANAAAANPENAALYQRFGCNAQEIRLIGQMLPKR